VLTDYIFKYILISALINRMDPYKAASITCQSVVISDTHYSGIPIINIRNRYGYSEHLQ